MLIGQLPDNEIAAIFKHTKSQYPFHYKDLTIEDLKEMECDAISSMFEWKNTPEGYDYWKEVSMSDCEEEIEIEI